MQENLLSLEDVKSHFENWRATKIKKREKIPQHLWDKVKLLIDRYTLVNIAQVLRLNTYQIRSNLKIQPIVNFAEAKIEPLTIFDNQSRLSTLIKGQTYSIELQRSNGTILRINSLPPESINKIISQFIG
jgi:hypothetical protein